MASGDTREQQYLGIAANGNRADLPTETCCETRTQTLTREVAERVIKLDEEVQEIKNNPDVVDIVDTYADLQAYDTQHLTDKDIIRVLNDESHDGDSTYYRFNKSDNQFVYVGKSETYSNFVGTDGTADGKAGLVPAPATTDSGKFLKADGTWSVAGGGACNWVVRTLTTDDYNYPTTNPNQLRVWKLPDGDYTLADNVTAYYASGYPIDGSSDRRVIIWHGDDYTRMLVFSTSSNASKKGKFVVTASGGPLFSEMLLSVRNDLNASGSADTINQPLSAYQGAVLNDKITKQGNTLSDTAPSTSTAGVLGQLYTDTTNMHTYQCTAISGSTYTWQQRW